MRVHQSSLNRMRIDGENNARDHYSDTAFKFVAKFPTINTLPNVVGADDNVIKLSTKMLAEHKRGPEHVSHTFDILLHKK